MVGDVLLWLRAFVSCARVKDHGRPVELVAFDARQSGDRRIRSFLIEADGVGTVDAALVQQGCRSRGRPCPERQSSTEVRTLPDGSLISNGGVLGAEYPNPGLLWLRPDLLPGGIGKPCFPDDRRRISWRRHAHVPRGDDYRKGLLVLHLFRRLAGNADGHRILPWRFRFVRLARDHARGRINGRPRGASGKLKATSSKAPSGFVAPMAK